MLNSGDVLCTNDLHCSILQYLDLRSLLATERVNKRWYKNATNPSSVVYLDFGNCFNSQTRDHESINSIIRSKNVKTFIWDIDHTMLELCYEFAYFDQISNLKLIFDIDFIEFEDLQCIQPLLWTILHIII